MPETTVPELYGHEIIVSKQGIYTQNVIPMWMGSTDKFYAERIAGMVSDIIFGFLGFVTVNYTDRVRTVCLARKPNHNIIPEPYIKNTNDQVFGLDIIICHVSLLWLKFHNREP
jgi:hypothetical protein